MSSVQSSSPMPGPSTSTAWPPPISAVAPMLDALLERVREAGVPADDARAASPGEGLNLIAFSGGVDSTLVAAIVARAFPTNTLAVIGVSDSLPLEQLELARDLAAFIGIPLRELKTEEGQVPEYVANAGASCYHCKTTLYQTMKDFSTALAAHFPEASNGQPLGGEGHAGARREVVLFNGTNADDLTDPTRLGLLAAQAYRVASPLATLSKAQVRELSRALGLPNWDYAASPCLRSRLAYGVPATSENLRRIEQAELRVRAHLQLQPGDNLRVRHLQGNVAALELDPLPLQRLEATRSELEPQLLALGFDRLISRAFQSGSVSRLASPGPIEFARDLGSMSV